MEEKSITAEEEDEEEEDEEEEKKKKNSKRFPNEQVQQYLSNMGDKKAN